MKNSLITIAVASYNNGKYIEHCVESVIQQTYSNLEILIVDDGSQDDTISRLEKYKSDNRIKFLCKENGGLSSVRQMALDMAAGDYICFIDADDYLAETYVESMLQKMLTDKSNVCVCSTEFVNEKGESLQKETKTFVCKESKHPINVTPQKIAEITNPTIKQLHLSDSWNKMYSISFIRSTGVRFCMPKGLNGSDSLFNRLLVLHSPKYSTVENAGYIHVIYKSSAVHRRKKNLIRSYLIISEKTISECEKIGIRQQMEQYISEKLYAQLYMAYLDVYRETESYKEAFSELRAIYSEYKEFVHKHRIKEVGVGQIRTHSVKMFIILLKWCKSVIPIYICIRESIKLK